MRNYRFLIVGFLALGLVACSTSYDAKTLLQGASTGYLLVDLKDGRVLEAENADQSYIPASTTKLLTSAAALDVLGSDYRFETSLFINGPIKKGILQGDLILEGGGDPLLDTDHLLDLASKLSRAGIIGITGHFYYTAARLPESPAIEASQPADAPYNPGISALSHDFNRFRVDWDGDTIQVMPPVETLKVGFQFGWFPMVGNGYEADKEVWYIADNSQRADQGSIWLPMRKPALQTAMVFRELAKLKGADLPKPEDPGKKGFGNPKVFAVHKSPPLHEVLQQGLEFSNNLVFELVGRWTAKMLVRDLSVHPDTTAIIMDWLKEQAPTADWASLNLPNHSGLSSEGRMSPRQGFEILKVYLQQKGKGDDPDPLSLLPAAGWAETQSERWRDPLIAMRVMSKSGTMNYTRGNIGLLVTESGRQLAFVLFTSDLTARAAYDKTRHREYGEDTALVNAWLNAAKDKEIGILKRWAEKY